MTLTFDTDAIAQLEQKGKDIFLTPEGEQSLIDFMELKKSVEEAEDRIKQALEASGLEISEDFKSISGDRVKVGYRYYGDKYRITEGLEDQVPSDYKKTTVKVYPDTKNIDVFLKEKQALPYGIETAPRKKQITIKRVGEDDAED